VPSGTTASGSATVIVTRIDPTHQPAGPAWRRPCCRSRQSGSKRRCSPDQASPARVHQRAASASARLLLRPPPQDELERRVELKSHSSTAASIATCAWPRLSRPSSQQQRGGDRAARRRSTRCRSGQAGRLFIDQRHHHFVERGHLGVGHARRAGTAPRTRGLPSARCSTNS
jgi:hypothetical protein